MKKIGIVSCDKWINMINEDIFLREFFINAGYDSEIISWQNNEIKYHEYDCLLLKSVWGYQDNYLEFKNWLLCLKESNTKLFNDVDMVLNNIRKDVQFRILNKNNIIHIPTTFIKSIGEIDDNLPIKVGTVIKPIISGSGNNTFRITNDKTELDKKIINIADVNFVYKSILENFENGLMLQPYIEEIETGEYSCVFINGTNTHNMLRFPGVFSSKKKPIHIENLPKDVRELANEISLLEDFRDHLYIRIDITYVRGIPMVMEVELAEPDLLTRYIENVKIKEHIGKQLIKGIKRRN